MKRTGSFHVYIVQCSNGSYYTGSTSNLKKRIERHRQGRGAKYLRGKAPIRLVYAKEYRYYKNVLRAERDLKKLKRKQKQALILNDAQTRKLMERALPPCSSRV